MSLLNYIMNSGSSGDSVAPPNGADTTASRGNALFNGTDSNYSFTNTADWILPDSDWHIVMLVDLCEIHGSSGTKHVLAMGTPGGNNSLSLYLANQRLGSQVRAVTTTNTLTSTTDIAKDTRGIIYIERTGTTLNLKWCPLNGTTVTHATATFVNPGSITPNSLPRIGCRGDSNAATFTANAIAYHYIGTGLLTNTEIQSLAAGQRYETDLGKTPQLRVTLAPSTNDNGSTISNTGTTVATKNGGVIIRGNIPFTGTPVTVTSTRFVNLVQRTAGTTTGTIQATGTYNGAPTTIEVALFTEAGTQVGSWQNATYPSTGNWAATFTTVPQGMYVIKARWSNDTTKFARSRGGHGVGIWFLGLGESIMEDQTTAATSDTAVTISRRYITSFNQKLGPTWYDYQGSTAPTIAIMLSQFYQRTGIPVGFAGAGYSGSQLVTGSPDNWSNATGSARTNATAAVTTVGGDYEHMIWFQGLNDGKGSTSITSTQYKDALTAVISNYRGLTGRTAAQCPVFVATMGRMGYTPITVAGNSQAVRAGQIAYVNSTTGAYFAGNNYDVALTTDLLHPDNGKTLPNTISLVDGTVTLANHGYPNYCAVQFGATGLPAGFTAGANWFVVTGAGTFKVASSLANAIAGVTITPTTVGSGTTSIVCPRGYPMLSKRVAQAMLNYFGASGITTGMKGATVLSAVASGNNITLTFQIHDGTALTQIVPGVILSGFSVTDSGGTPKTLVSTSIATATTVVLTLATAAAAGDLANYVPLSDVDASNCLYTNATVVDDAVPVPVLPFSSAITVT